MGYLLMIGFLVFGIYALTVAEKDEDNSCKCDHCNKCKHDK